MVAVIKVVNLMKRQCTPVGVMCCESIRSSASSRTTVFPEPVGDDTTCKHNQCELTGRDGICA